MDTTTAPTDSYINKVAALLAKAERTEFPAEAEAFMAAAQRLMTTHAITEAMLNKARGVNEDLIGDDVVLCTNPYALGKAHLLNGIAKSNDVQLLVMGNSKDGKHCSLVGHASDIENVKLLYGALLVHGTREMLHATVPAYDNTRSFRASFMLAYASRIAQRLAEARTAAVAEHEASTGESVAVVLADRSRAVARRYASMYPNVRTTRASARSSAGAGSGRTAADRADIGGTRIGGQGRRALGS